jgi:hypothetical protein
MKKRASARGSRKNASPSAGIATGQESQEKTQEIRLSDWLIPALFLFLPFAIILPGLIWKSHRLFFILFGLIVVAVSLKNIWIRSFLVYSVIWQLFLYLKAFSIPKVNTGDGLAVVIAFLAGAIVFKFVAESKLPNESFYAVIRIAVLLQIAIAIPQYLGFNPVSWVLSLAVDTKEVQPGHLTGTIGNRNFLAAFIAISVPMFIGWRSFTREIPAPSWLKRPSSWKIRINPWLVIIAAVLFLAPSPGSLAAIIGLAVYFRLGWKYAVLAIVVAIGFAAYYIVGMGVHLEEFKALPQQITELIQKGEISVDSGQHDLGRFGMWMVALGKLFTSWESVIFGFGPGATFGRRYPLHNEYMSMWFEFGLVGLTLMAGYIVTTIKGLVRAANPVLLTSFAIACLDMMGNYPMQIAPTAFLIIIVCGLIERERSCVPAIDRSGNVRK